MARKVSEPDNPESMNMTPMIDVTFQLIIFFMLVSDMTQQQIERLELPSATKAVKEKYADEKMLVLNIKKDGTVWLQGKKIFTPPPQGKGQKYDSKKLEDLFISRRQQPIYQDPANENFVNYPLLLRCDRSSSWEWVQLVMMIASQEGGVTDVQMGTVLEETGGGA